MKNFTYLLIATLLFSSCEKVLFDKDLSATSPQANFEYLWNECNEKFSFFEVKDIDWAAKKTEYAAQISETMSDDELFNVLENMLNDLKDGHTNLISNFDISAFSVAHLGQDNFDWRIIEDNYLSDDYYITGPFQHDFIADNEIGYVRFPAFTGGISPSNIDFIINRYKDTKGLIIDLRENGGGVTTDIFSLLSRFVEEETLVYYSRIKTGPGLTDFSEAEPAYVSPYAGIRYTNKVAVLTDRGTYSAGSFTALATLALPNMVLVGDTTGGGLGLPNGGQLPNGWTYRFSVTQTLTLDKNPEYENGVPVDVPVLFDWTDLTKDEIIEQAILEIL
jgi:C-terminal processing protease CtpA/Prc